MTIKTVADLRRALRRFPGQDELVFEDGATLRGVTSPRRGVVQLESEPPADAPEQQADLVLLGPGAAAKQLGVTPRTIERYRLTGRLAVHHYTPGGHARFTPEAVEAARHKKKPGPPKREPEPYRYTREGAPIPRAEDFAFIRNLLAKRRITQR